MAALQRWAADSFGVDSLGQDPLVIRAMKVAGRLAVLTKRQKLPLSAEQLSRVVMYLNSGKEGAYIAVRDNAMFQLGWAGMLRSSELVGLQWQQVTFTQDGGVMLDIPESKTDPGEGSWVLVSCGRNRGIDPAMALKELRLLAGGETAVGPVFLPKAGAAKALATTTVAVRLRKALERAGTEH